MLLQVDWRTLQYFGLLPQPVPLWRQLRQASGQRFSLPLPLREARHLLRIQLVHYFFKVLSGDKFKFFDANFVTLEVLLMIFLFPDVDITRPSLAPISSEISSYIIYPLSQMGSGDRFDLRLRFQTTDMDQIALLAFVGQSGRHDSHSQHLALTFVKGYVMLTWNMGGGKLS